MIYCCHWVTEWTWATCRRSSGGDLHAIPLSLCVVAVGTYVMLLSLSASLVIVYYCFVPFYVSSGCSNLNLIVVVLYTISIIVWCVVGLMLLCCVGFV